MLDVQDILVDYGGTWALRASCSFGTQTWTSVLGPSGAGKTTLVQALAGFVPLRTGRILRDGHVISTLPPAKRGFGYVFQHDNLFEHLSVQQNLLLATHDDPAPRSSRLARVTAVVERLDLPAAYLAKRPGDLSGGERARIAVARALVRGHRWLILDEAFGALDEPLRLSIQSWIESLILGDESLSVISLTHQVREAHLFSDRILVIEGGRITFDGSTDGSVDDTRSRAVTGAPPAKRTLASLDERWSWLDGRVVSENGRGSSAIPLAPGEWRWDAPPAMAGQRWTQVVLKRPRLISTAGGYVLRDRGTGTMLRSPDAAKPLTAAPAITPTAALTIHVLSEALTSG